MDTLARVIKKILGNNTALTQGLQDARILETWVLSVGDALAKHTRAVQMKNKTLFIEVDHPIWKQELHANKQLALKRLNEKLNEGMEHPQTWVEDLFLVSPTPNRYQNRKKD